MTNYNKEMAKGNYAYINGLNMYYEIYGTGRPLILLHGALSTIDTSFGKLIPSLSKIRQVIAIEQQAHGHTADIDRPLTFKQMADDTTLLLRHLGVEKADIFGYSMGAGIGLHIAIQTPDLVDKLVFMAFGYNSNGIHSGVLEMMEKLKSESFLGSGLQEEYSLVAPNPENWSTLLAKVKQLIHNVPDWPAEAIMSIKAPILVIIGDSDVIRPEHAVDMFRLLGGGVPGDFVDLPNSHLAVLPCTTHIKLMERDDWLLSMITTFLEPSVQEQNMDSMQFLRKLIEK